MADKKLKLTIKSDGTAQGTSLVVNGADLTKQMNLTGVSFSAYDDGSVWISWTAMEKDDKGVEKRVSYTFRSPSESNVEVVKRPSSKVIIGKDSETQFETNQDKAAYELTGSLKKLEDVITVTDETKVKCECIKCGHTMMSDQHCKDIDCPKCGGTMRRKDRPGPGQSK